MDLFLKRRWAVVLASLLAVVCGGLLAARLMNPSVPVIVDDWGACPNGMVTSQDTGPVVPAHGVIIEHLDQPGCSLLVKDQQRRVYRHVIRSHRYVIVRGDGFTVTQLVDQESPADCNVGATFMHCLFPRLR